MCIRDSSDRSKIHSVLSEFINFKGPVLLNCHVVEDENCYPMVAPGKSNSQMIGVQKQPKRKSKQDIEIPA